MADMDTTMVGSLVRLTMNNPTVPIMVAGDLATTWRRFAAVTIVHPMEAAAHLGMLIDPRLLPARYRLFRRIRGLSAVVAVMVAATGDVKSFANRARTR
jgi:hypothetical protein